MNGKPDRIFVIPKSFPGLQHHINDISWNCVDNTITLDIAETLNFNTFNWINNINIVKDSLLNSAFGNTKKEVISLEFRNRVELVAEVILLGLELMYHKCDTSKGLMHNVIIKYEKMEIIDKKH